MKFSACSYIFSSLFLSLLAIWPVLPAGTWQIKIRIRLSMRLDSRSNDTPPADYLQADLGGITSSVILFPYFVVTTTSEHQLDKVQSKVIISPVRLRGSQRSGIDSVQQTAIFICQIFLFLRMIEIWNKRAHNKCILRKWGNQSILWFLPSINSKLFIWHPN